jgi:hypothetical protein
MIGAFMINRPIFKSLHSQDFMDPNDNVYTSNFTCPKTKVVAWAQNFFMPEGPTPPHDFNPFLYSCHEPCYNVFNVKNILATSNTRHVQHPKFACIRMICMMVLHFEVLSLLR